MIMFDNYFLELDNEQVSRTWLQLLNEANVSVDAAVFFDSNDKLMVLDRLNTITPFELSTFRNRLDRCVVYLDDAHTRGTDLKIPSGNRAVVTLGKGVGKDKLVQGEIFCLFSNNLILRPEVLIYVNNRNVM